MGLHPRLGWLCRWHGQRVGVPQQDGQQRRRRLPADLPPLCGHLQLRGSARRIRYGSALRHRHVGLLRERLGHPGQDHGQGRRPAGLAAPGRLHVHRHRLRGHRHLRPQSTGGLGAGHPHAHGRWQLVCLLLRRALLRHPLPHRRGGGHPADPVPGRQEHRAHQQGYDAVVLYHLPGSGSPCGLPGRLRRRVSVHVRPPVGDAG